MRQSNYAKSNDTSIFSTIRILTYYKFFSSYSLGQRVYHETKFSVLTVFLGGLLLKKTAAVYMFSLYPLLKLSEREKKKILKVREEYSVVYTL